MSDICIVCQTNEVNPMISKNHCSRICWNLSLRIDMKYLSEDAIKRIALKQLAEVANKTNYE